MDLRHEKELKEKFPVLFGEMFEDTPTKYGIHWGIETADGWYAIIRGMCAELVEAYETGKTPINPVFHQVKEKFGLLRVYLARTDEVLEDIITKYEGLSSELCELCGKRGELRYDGWITVLCDKHNEEVKKD